MDPPININSERLEQYIRRLGQCGALEGGGVSRMALTPENKAGRDLVVSWMRALGLAITIDRIGNVMGYREGTAPGPPVIIGSHIDTVRRAGLYDGALGVLAGLEVIHSLNDANIVTRHPLAVALFTNEEGALFTPDMMGSMVHQGQLDLDAMLVRPGSHGKTVGDCLEEIGYAGAEPTGTITPRAYLELHIEQGPVLEQSSITIGAVRGVQGISWTEIHITGVANHAGTTPMALRHDAGFAAAAVAQFVRDMAEKMGNNQLGTVGSIKLEPDMINVIAGQATLTVDLRNTDENQLQLAEKELKGYLANLEKSEGVRIATQSLARFQPTGFDDAMVELILEEATNRGYSVKSMFSGAGHDAQSFAPNCPTAMIFVPSVGGISHSIDEYSKPEDIAAGANVLLGVALKLVNGTA